MASPLFDDDAPLDIVFDGPLYRLINDTRKQLERPFALTVDGRVLNVSLRTRGNSRLESCKFPPIWVDLEEADTAGTVFAEQKRVKLVTHCDRSRRYLVNTLEEYNAYRIFNRVTDASFKVRLAHVVYKDNGKARNDSYGFFIEHHDELAKRLDGKRDKRPLIGRADLDKLQATQVAIFQYLIGNTDFSMISGEKGGPCCHNGRLIDTDRGLLTIPYDFDISGLVNPPYGYPSRIFRIKRVTQRRYWGFCTDDDTLTRALEPFLAMRGELPDMFRDTPGFERNEPETGLRFLEGFFEEVDETGIARFVEDCR